MKFQNSTNIPLPVAVWLAAVGDYDLVPDPQVISATSLLRPLRSLVLGRRALQEQEVDIDMLVAQKLGSATHTAIEQAWKHGYQPAMEALGFAEGVIKKIVVNPNLSRTESDDIVPIYIEQRRNTEVEGFIVSGKFDFCIDGELHDVKTTKTYSYISGSNDEDYRKQASIYRWLNQDIVTEDHFYINYIFTDWTPLRAQADKDYPQSRVLAKKYELYSLAETEAFVRQKLQQIKKYDQAPQEELPECDPKELWQDPPTWAVYKDPNKTAKATRVLHTPQDAALYNTIKCGGKGLIIERKSEPKRCLYCEANPICLQADRFRAEGLLK